MQAGFGIAEVARELRPRGDPAAEERVLIVAGHLDQLVVLEVELSGACVKAVAAAAKLDLAGLAVFAGGAERIATDAFIAAACVGLIRRRAALAAEFAELPVAPNSSQ